MTAANGLIARMQVLLGGPRVTAFTAAIFLLLSANADAQTTIWGELEPGPSEIGFRVIQTADATRPLEDGNARPLQVWLWYPTAVSADTNASAELVYGDYFELAETDLGERITGRSGGVDNLRRRIRALGVSEDDVDLAFAADMLARRDAAPDGLPHRVVFIAQGNGNSPYAQALLSEYLASWGFVVAATPSQSRIAPPPDDAPNPARHAAESQAGDIRFVLDRLTQWLPAAQTDGIGIVGYSFGARSALVYALRYGDVAALVSMDGGIGNAAGNDFLDDAPYFDPGALATPILHLYQPGDRTVTPDFTLIRRFQNSDRTLVLFDGMTHGDFSFAPMMETLGPAFVAAVPEGMRPKSGFEALADFTLKFLQKHVLGSDDAETVPSPTAVQRAAKVEDLPAGG